MNEAEALALMVAPGTPRAGKYRQGVVQILVTSMCDKSCFGCTQNSQLKRPREFMPVNAFEEAVRSLKGYWGVIGMFGGNPALHPEFEQLCNVLRQHVPREQRGIWCNNPLGKGRAMRETFDPAVSNLNVHLDAVAYNEFKRDWPECNPVGLYEDSRHSPCMVSMRDIGVPEEERWERISRCDINQHWSAMLGMWRGQLRAWFCEVAGAQAIHHQHDADYPDTGISPAIRYSLGGYDTGDELSWWQLKMGLFAHQVRQHCHDCSVPMRGHGELACSTDGAEQVSATHAVNFQPKRKGRRVELITVREELGDPLGRVTHYLQNARV